MSIAAISMAPMRRMHAVTTGDTRPLARLAQLQVPEPTPTAWTRATNLSLPHPATDLAFRHLLAHCPPVEYI
jgi:hypothetical protein